MKYILSFLGGIKFKNENEYIRLGSFLICNDKYLMQNFPEDFTKNNTYNDFSYLLYECKEKSIETDYFKNLYSDKIKLFLNTILYCIDERAFTLPKVSYSNNNNINKNLYYSGDEYSLGIKFCTSSIFSPSCCISNKMFNRSGNTLKLFDYIEKEPSSEIEQKIFLAVKWIGEGLTHSDLRIGYMCLCIALETLLSGKNSPLERGTAYQLREYAALLATKKKQERLKIYQSVKYLYGLRCSLSHAGEAKDLTEKKFYELLKILKMIINTLFVLLETNNIQSFKQLQEYIDNIKF